MQIDTVHQRPGNFSLILSDLLGAAAAGADTVAEITARARIHGGHQHELGGKSGRDGRTGDGYCPFFERLAQSFERVSFEFRKLVQEKNA